MQNPPANVGKKAMWSELQRKQRKEDKVKAEQKKLTSTLTTAGVGGLTAVASGLLMARFPRLQSFDKGGKVKTAPILGAAAFIGALMTDKGMSNGLEGASYALVFPFLSNWGGRLNAQIPG